MSGCGRLLLLWGLLMLPGIRGSWRQRRLLCTCICTALLSWITLAHLVPLSVTKRCPVHFILNPGHRVWARHTNGLKIVSTRGGFEPTISCLKVECTNHLVTQPNNVTGRSMLTFIVLPHRNIIHDTWHDIPSATHDMIFHPATLYKIFHLFDCIGVERRVSPYGSFCVASQRKEKRDRRDSRGEEREGQGRKKKTNESKETKEIKIFPCTLTYCKDSRPCPAVSQSQLDSTMT